MKIAPKNCVAADPIRDRTGQAGFFTAGLGLALAAFLGVAAASVVVSDQDTQETTARQEQLQTAETEIHVDP